MRAHIATGILGSFAFDSSGKAIAHRLFPKRPDVIAGKLRKSRTGEILPEELEIIRELSKEGYKEIVWSKDKQVRGMVCIHKGDNLSPPRPSSTKSFPRSISSSPGQSSGGRGATR
jgi:hypothetical protein